MHFFFSYARQDAFRTPLAKFQKDIENRLCSLATSSSIQCFCDVDSIRPGEPWRDAIESALRSADAFIAFCSPEYFASEYCGKEWAAFDGRIDKAGLPSEARGLLVPVMWETLEYSPPPANVAARQLLVSRHLGLDNDLAAGVHQLLRRGTNRDYDDIVDRLAGLLLKVVSTHQLPPIETLPALIEISNPFHSADVRISRPSGDEKIGPRGIHFIVLVGTASELQGSVRRDISAYGDDWREWCPCPSSSELQAWQLLANAAIAQQLCPVWATTGDDIRSLLKTAQKNQNVVLLVADNWSLFLEPYMKAAKLFDRYNYYNCVAIVPCAKNDSEVIGRENELVQNVVIALENHVAKCGLNGVRFWVSDASDVEGAVSSQIAEAKKRIYKMGEVRAIRGAGPTSCPRLT